MTSRHSAVTPSRPAQVQNTVATPHAPPRPRYRRRARARLERCQRRAPVTLIAGTLRARLDSIETENERFVVPNGNP